MLLIIFMLTAPILESGIEVDLPKTKTVKVVSEEKVVITIDKKQNIYVGNDPVNIHRLGVTVLDQLKGAGTQPVFIRCDQNVSFGAFARVVDALKQANLTNLNIVTEPLETKPRLVDVNRLLYGHARHGHDRTNAATRCAARCWFP